MRVVKKTLTLAFFWGIISYFTAFSVVAGGVSPTSPFKPLKPINASSQQAHSYIGANIASSQLDADCNTSTCEYDSQAWRVYGGYPLSQQLIIEAGYDHLGEFTNSDQSASVKGISASLLLVAPVNEQISVFGRSGYYKWESEIDNGQQKTKASDIDPVLGLGADYRLNDNMRIRAEWDNYKGILIDDAGKASDVNSLGLGVTFSSL